MASIRKRGETFTITAYLGYNNEGKQIKKTTTFRPPENVTAGKAEKLAREFAVVWEKQVKGYVALDENITFAELADWYYETVAPNVLREQTLIPNRRAMENHVIPRIGREKLKNITPPMLDSMFCDIRKSGNTKTKFRFKDRSVIDNINKTKFCKEINIDRTTIRSARDNCVTFEIAKKIAQGLAIPFNALFDDVTPTKEISGSTLKKIKLNLSAIFTAAVKKEIMRRNPCSLVTCAKSDTLPVKCLDEEQSRKFLEALKEQDDFQLEVIGNLFLATGIRPGELCALHWDDVDLKTGLLNIRHTLFRLNGQFRREVPKTNKSERKIILPKYIINLLKKHKKLQEKYSRGLGDTWINRGAVFTNLTGNYTSRSYIGRKIKLVLESADLPPLKLHSLRHTHASILINSGIATKIIADRLGHSETETTQNIYGHVFEESKVKTMQAVEMALFT